MSGGRQTLTVAWLNAPAWWQAEKKSELQRRLTRPTRLGRGMCRRRSGLVVCPETARAARTTRQAGRMWVLRLSRTQVSMLLLRVLGDVAADPAGPRERRA